uniref:EOG090X0431 n=1 Tax=Daphnia pulicaria TaxID=35523 RepID=A0A4Y7MXR1_9CRUS|nr:EOG090X0431 [Daphnia pulicaria]
MVEEEKNVIIEILTEYLSPFCFTLQHLQLEDLEEKKKFRKGSEFSGLYPASVALLLRHMPNLRRIDHSGSSVSSAIKLLHQIPPANETLGSNHKNIYEASQDYTNPRLPSPFITNSPFSGIISLTSIDFVNIRDEILMKAVGRMCPHLKEVTFSELLHTDAISPDQLFSILTTEWPKDQNGPYETSDEELSSGDSDESSHGFGTRNDLDAREDYGGWMDEIDVFNEDVEDFFEEYDDDEDVEDFFEENDDGEDDFLNWPYPYQVPHGQMTYYPYAYGYPTPMQGQWMGQGTWNGAGYQMPPVTSSSGNAAAPPPLPSLPPPPPPPPPPPTLSTSFEPPPPGSIKFTIPSKGSNKLQKVKQENKAPGPIQVPQYPTSPQVATSSAQQNIQNKSPEQTFSQAKGSGMPVDWPDSLRRYVERCFAMCQSSVDKDFVELILKGKITSASREGKALSKDWDNEPLPNLSRVENAVPTSGVASSLKAGTSGFNVSPMKNGVNILGSTAGGASAFRMQPNSGQDISPFKTAPSSIGISAVKPVTDTPSFKNGAASNSSNNSYKTGASILGISALKTSVGTKQNQISFQFKGQRKALYGGLGLGSVNRTVLGANWTSPDKLRKRQARFQVPKKTRLTTLGDSSLYREDVTGEEDWSNLLIVGTCCEVEKPFFRLTAAPDPSTVRPVHILKKALYKVKTSWVANPDYRSCCDQMKSIRQDLTVQGIRDSFTVEVYETHARLALEAADHEEFNQCQTQLKALHHELGGKNLLEFTAYRILYYIFTKSTMDLNTTMASLTREEKADDCVAHALEVRSSWALANFRRFFRLYNHAPRMSAHLMSWFADRERKLALKTLIKAYRPNIPVELVTTQLGFPTLDAWYDFSKELPIVYSDDSKAQIDCKASTANLTAW